jgi:hypothetical protein
LPLAGLNPFSASKSPYLSCWCIRARHSGDAGHGGRFAPAGKLIIVNRAAIPPRSPQWQPG